MIHRESLSSPTATSFPDASASSVGVSASPPPPPPAFAAMYGGGTFQKRRRQLGAARPGAAGGVVDLGMLAAAAAAEEAAGPSSSSSLPQPQPQRNDAAERGGPSRVLDFVYVGGVSDAQDAAFLRSHNITHIINVSAEQYWCVDRRIRVHPFPIEDTPDADIASVFPKTNALLEAAARRYWKAVRKQASSTAAAAADAGAEPAGATAPPPCVLVHCAKGRSRSVSVVMAYLIHRTGCSVAEALTYVSARRPAAAPNLGFVAALLRWQTAEGDERRSRRNKMHSVVLTGVDNTTTAAAVAEFLESRVGMVRLVAMRCVSGGSTPPSNGQPAASGDAALPTTSSADSLTPTSAAAPPLRPSTAVCVVFFALWENTVRTIEHFRAHPEQLHCLNASGAPFRVRLPTRLRKGHDNAQGEEEEAEEGQVDNS